MLHELGHLLNGYIDYLRSEGILAWDETSNITTALSDLEQAQVLEYDADCFGWNNVINWLFTIYTTSGKVADKTTKLDKSLEDALGLAVLAIYTTFRLFGRNTLPEAKLLLHKHAHPKLRRALFIGVAQSLFSLKFTRVSLTQE